MFEETYFINFVIQNKGNFKSNVSGDVSISYGDVTIDKQIYIKNWNPSQKANVSFNSLPFSYNFTTGKIKIKWKTTVNGLIYENQNKANFSKSVKSNNADSRGENSVRNDGSIEPNYCIESISTNSLCDGGGTTEPQYEIQNAYVDGAEFVKGEGPKLVIVIHFNRATSSISTNWKIQSQRFGWATYIGGVSWSGSFGAGSNWALSYKLSWNMLGGDYAYGISDYKLRRASAYGGGGTTQYYPSSGDSDIDSFSVKDESSYNIVFRYVLDDGYTVSESGRSLSNIFDDANSKFDHGAPYVNYFKIKFYQFYTTYDWAQSWDGQVGSVYHWDRMTELSDSELWTNMKNGFQSKTGSSWTEYSQTHSSNRGYDLLYGISGSYRLEYTSSTGLAKRPGNIAFNFAGKGLFCWNYDCYAGWYMGDNLWDNIVQHETSHNFGVGHVNEGEHIMNSKPVVIGDGDAESFLYNDDWINWLFEHEEILVQNQNTFST